MTSATSARDSNTAEIGRVTNTLRSPREMINARRRFSYNNGARTKPNSSGTASHPQRMRK